MFRVFYELFVYIVMFRRTMVGLIFVYKDILYGNKFSVINRIDFNFFLVIIIWKIDVKM